MVILLLITVIPVFLGIVLAKPKWGSLLVWPILFTYPHSWWFYHQYLPLNIGFDDLFCIFLFLAVLFRRNLLGGVPVRFGYAFWVITTFVIIVAMANFAGSRDLVGVERIKYIKDVLKLGVYWALFYAILHCIDDERDLKIQLTAFSIAAALGAIIVILQYFFPYRMEAFAAPFWFEGRGLPFGRRASGSFLNANTAACVLACSLVLVTTAVPLQKRVISKTMIYSVIFVLLAGVLLTRSRSGLIALVLTFVLIAFLGRNKKFAWFVIIAAILLAVMFTGARRAFQRRVVEVYEPRTGVWGRNIVGRFRTWRGYFATATTKDYLLGKGFRKGIVVNGTESHSTYVSLITVYGIAGIIWAAIALIIFFRKALILKAFPDPFISTVSAGCIWALIAWGLYSGAADALNTPHARFLLFYMVVLIDRAHYIALAGQQQESLLRGEQTEQLAMQYAGVESY